MSGSYYFAIVAHNDNPIFEMDYVNTNKEIKVSSLFDSLASVSLKTTHLILERGPQTSQSVHSTCSPGSSRRTQMENVQHVFEIN